MRTHLKLLFAATTLAAGAHAQPAVIPGVTLAYKPPTSSEEIIYRRTITTKGVDSSEGTRNVSIRLIAAGASHTIEVVQVFAGQGGIITDTAIAELPTLRALAHRSHQPSKVMSFDFTAMGAHGRITPVGAAAAIDTTMNLGGPIFDSNIIEMVVAALPLAPAFKADVPFFIYERGGRVTMSVVVKERARSKFLLGDRDAWVVNVAVPGSPATVWVDVATRTVLRVRYEIAARQMAFTDDRTTPLPK